MVDLRYEAGPFQGPDDEWDAYVRAHPEGRFCHLSGYLEAVRASYGAVPHRFALRHDGRLCGVVAASAARTLLFGRKWVSLPYGEYGGFLVDADVPADAARALGGALVGAARRAGARAVEVNGLLGLPDGVADDFEPAVRYELAMLDLSPGPEALFEKRFKYEVRKAVRKAESRGLVAREASDPDTLRDVFYPMFLASMHRLGVPPHGLRYFVELKARFGDDVRVLWAERDGRPLAGLFGVRTGPRVQVTVTVSTPEGWEDRPNDLAHWAFIKWACEIGARWFDFGSVRYEGQHHYKSKWAATFVPAAHWVAPLATHVKRATFDSSSGAMARASAVWKRTVPLGITAWLGPIVRRQLLR